MDHEHTCQFCGRPAIGMQILGCIAQYVCEIHAEQPLVEMDPGTKLDHGACYYVRYTDDEGKQS